MNHLWKISAVIFCMQLVSPCLSVRQQIGQFYFLNWELDYPASRIIIELEVETLGYVGFGLARTPFVGLMNEADIVIGGVNPDGTFYISDRHGDRNEVPVVDEQQDVTHISSSQNGTHTRVKYWRPFKTGDSDDVDIIFGEQTIIWSFGETDEIAYHGGINRSSTRINWLAL